MKKVAILQSNYIPWKGYFDLISSVDEFILYDDMQYTRRDWRNRNQIKTPTGLSWLTVPVNSKGRYYQKIRETTIDGTDWSIDHWKSLVQNYRKAPHFEEVASWLEPLYVSQSYSSISQLNRQFIEAICSFLGIATSISNSWDYDLVDGKTERLVDLCKQAGAGLYISGPSAKNYIVEEQFTKEGIELLWFDYAGYPEYPQLWGEFNHAVTILDVLFNCGNESLQYVRRKA
ncbi:WbqC family protein [Chitiniphilus shinanonensis]|uniref:WbqC family protein n=1 Tax=Chitiniphilus shinanonensis TaxID=553088 RepID=UPI00304BCE2D